MNFTLIPFFLAANVIVNDTSEWKFGPEYSYNINITYEIKTNFYKHVDTVQLISTMKCRPETLDRLFCHLHNFTTLRFVNNRNTTQEEMTEQMFMIKFNKHGVEGLMVEPTPRTMIVNILRRIATQFNINPRVTSHFIIRENSTMGNCKTFYRITREEPEADMLEECSQENTNFQLVILSLADAKPDTTLLIEKIRGRCINPPQYIDFSTGFLKMGRFVSKIQISDRFETCTEFDGELSLMLESISGPVSYKEIIQISLNSIQPAQNKLPILSYDKLIDLNINNVIGSNLCKLKQ